MPPDHRCHRPACRRLVIICGLGLLPALAATAEIAPDEQIVFFPTCARWDATAGQWIIPIHGWIFEPETDSIRRGLLLAALREALDLDEDLGGEVIFTARAVPFLADNESRKKLELRVGNRPHALRPSERNGHIIDGIWLTGEEADRLAATDEFGRRWIEFTAVTPPSDQRRFAGRSLLVGGVGLSVISDIDDTIKVTQVKDRKKMLHNTFLRPYSAVPGMADLYRRWAQQGAVFHYISASPWQLYEPLSTFMDISGFPAGSFLLKTFYWKDSRFMALFADPREYKIASIEPVLRLYPHRRFVLVGDSGEKDPEAYGELARRYPEQIAHMLIRAISRETRDDPRLRDAFRNVPQEQWTVFAHADELTNVNLATISQSRPAFAPPAAPASGTQPE